MRYIYLDLQWHIMYNVITPMKGVIALKDKLLQIRVDDSFLSKLEYLQKINGFKTVSETVRKIVEKEFRKETMKQ